MVEATLKFNQRALACKNGNGDACAFVGRSVLRNGSDLRKALFWFTKGAESGSKLSIYYIAYVYYIEGKHAVSEQILLRLLKVDYLPAMYTWSMLSAHRRWSNEPSNSNNPRAVMKAAARLGHVPAKLVLLADGVFFEFSKVSKIRSYSRGLLLIAKMILMPDWIGSVKYLTWPDFDHPGHKF